MSSGCEGAMLGDIAILTGGQVDAASTIALVGFDDLVVALASDGPVDGALGDSLLRRSVSFLVVVVRGGL